MKQTKETHPLGFYIFESKVSANSNYIENLQEAKNLLTYLNYYLNDYLVIHDYMISRHGIQLAVKLESEEKIRKSYERTYKGFTKSEIDIWKIISERMRICLSTFVRSVNFSRNRTGVLVQCSYRKYYFESLSEALSHLDKLRNQMVKLYQRKKQYRGIKKHYKIPHAIGTGSVFLCSKELRTKSKKKLKNQAEWDLTDLVVQKWVNLTLSLQSHTKNNKNHYQNTKNAP